MLRHTSRSTPVAVLSAIALSLVAACSTTDDGGGDTDAGDAGDAGNSEDAASVSDARAGSKMDSALPPASICLYAKQFLCVVLIETPNGEDPTSFCGIAGGVTVPYCASQYLEAECTSEINNGEAFYYYGGNTETTSDQMAACQAIDGVYETFTIP